MSHPNENWDKLDTLLSCKRYEQPPPGYFVSFADKVIARIEAEEVTPYSGWWDWLVARFDAKPVLVCAYTLAASSLLFLGFRLSQADEADLGATPRPTGPWLAVTPASPFLVSQGFREPQYTETPVTSFGIQRTAFREDSEHLPFPATTLRFQPVGLPRSPRY